MATKVPTLVLKGLTEGLALRTAEREPVAGDELVDRFEELLDHRPHDNQVQPVVARLVDEDLLRDTEGDGLRLTQDGARRLEAYRRLPDAFKRTLVDLFRIDPTSLNPDAASRSPSSSRRVEADGRGRVEGEGWVPELLGEIPTDVEVRARYARVTLDRDPAARSWALEVKRHEPGRYEGAQACPLTFLYEAATRLIHGARAPRDEAQASAAGSSSP